MCLLFVLVITECNRMRGKSLNDCFILCDCSQTARSNWLSVSIIIFQSKIRKRFLKYRSFNIKRCDFLLILEIFTLMFQFFLFAMIFHFTKERFTLTTLALIYKYFWHHRNYVNEVTLLKENSIVSCGLKPFHVGLHSCTTKYSTTEAT